MTDQQYESCKSNNIKIYQIWIKGGKFHKKLCEYEQFDKYQSKRIWLNKFVPYDTALQAYFMYTTEDKLDQCKKKLQREDTEWMLYQMMRTRKSKKVVIRLKCINLSGGLLTFHSILSAGSVVVGS